MKIYRTILKKAWNISWKNKYLWFFGLFATFLINTGEYNVISRILGRSPDANFFPFFTELAETGIFKWQTLSNIKMLLLTNPLDIILIFFILLLVLALAVFILWLSNVSMGALVNNTAVFLSEKKKPVLQDGLNRGMKKFWPILGMNVALKVVTFIIVVLVTYPMILAASSTGSILIDSLQVLLFVLGVVVAIVVSFIIKYSIAYSVLKNYSFVKSISSAWTLFVKNWLVSVEMAIILFVINVLAGLCVGIVVLIIVSPLLVITFILYTKFAISAALFLLFICLVLMILIIMICGSLITTFQISSWTTLFVELVGKGAISKVVRMFGTKKQ